MGAFSNTFSPNVAHIGTLLNYLLDSEGNKLYDSEGKVLTAKKE